MTYIAQIILEADTTAIDAANAKIDELQDLVNRILINHDVVGIDIEDEVLLEQLEIATETIET